MGPSLDQNDLIRIMMFYQIERRLIPSCKTSIRSSQTFWEFQNLIHLKIRAERATVFG